MERNDPQNTEFVADGHWRARKALEEEIRPVVEREFADRMNRASFLWRFRLRRAIEREIERRVDEQIKEIAPPDALY